MECGPGSHTPPPASQGGSWGEQSRRGGCLLRPAGLGMCPWPAPDGLWLPLEMRAAHGTELVSSGSTPRMCRVQGRNAENPRPQKHSSKAEPPTGERGHLLWSQGTHPPDGCAGRTWRGCRNCPDVIPLGREEAPASHLSGLSSRNRTVCRGGGCPSLLPPEPLLEGTGRQGQKQARGGQGMWPRPHVAGSECGPPTLPGAWWTAQDRGLAGTQPLGPGILC